MALTNGPRSWVLPRSIGQSMERVDQLAFVLVEGVGVSRCWWPEPSSLRDGVVHQLGQSDDSTAAGGGVARHGCSWMLGIQIGLQACPHPPQGRAGVRRGCGGYIHTRNPCMRMLVFQ